MGEESRGGGLEIAALNPCLRIETWGTEVCCWSTRNGVLARAEAVVGEGQPEDEPEQAHGAGGDEGGSPAVAER